jgi:GT2 family glycosyltransferase
MSSHGFASDVTVVIPTLGRASLAACVHSIATGTVTPAEIIVSHQGRPGSLDSMLKAFAGLDVPTRYVHCDRRGCAAGRNTGIDLVKTRFMAWTDDDCVVDAHWLELLVKTLRTHPNHIVTGRVLAGSAGAPSVQTGLTPQLFRRSPLSGDRLSAGNCGMALAVFQDVGLLDEGELVRYCEDNEWGFRAMSKGYPIHFVPEVTITHYHGGNEEDLVRVHSEYARSQGGWYGRMLRRREPIFAVRLISDLLRGARRWALGSLRGDRTKAANGRAWVVELLRGVLSGLKEKDA